MSLADIFDKADIKICEVLPGNMTLFERDGFCIKPSDGCKYCDAVRELQGKKHYICNKMTYTADPVTN
jgi:hypothetical protein